MFASQLVERFNGRLPGYSGPGKDRHSFSHVDDVVIGHLAALENGKPGERYLLTGDVHSINDVLDFAADLTNTSKPRFVVPLWAMTVAGYGFILFARLTGSKPVITPQVSLECMKNISSRCIVTPMTKTFCAKPFALYLEISKRRSQLKRTCTLLT